MLELIDHHNGRFEFGDLLNERFVSQQIAIHGA